MIRTCGGCTNKSISTGAPCDPTITYAGAVLETYERNGYDDSDFIAIVWDGERVTTKMYATTAGWTYHNSATVDAPPAVVTAARAWFAALLTDRNIAAAATRLPERGDKARSLTVRGKNKGVEGEVRWVGPDDYRSRPGQPYYRVGIKVDGEDKLRYIDAARVEIIGGAEVDPLECAARATARAALPGFRSLVELCGIR